MAETTDKPTVDMTKEERIAAAKARAAERAKAAEQTGQATEKAAGSEETLGAAAQRFQTLKDGQTLTQSRKEREAALMNRAVDISPRSTIETLPQAAPTKAQGLAINRREFLIYAWGGALALIAVQGGLGTLWLAYPRFKAGEFGGTFTLTTIPAQGAEPAENLSGKFWWTNAEAGGMAALYKVCTHLGCLYEWKDQTNRFECPCHGSKFNQSGQNIQGPATRDLDQFVVTVRDLNGAEVDKTTAEHRYVTAQDGYTYDIDTGRKIPGEPSDPSIAVEI